MAKNTIMVLCSAGMSTSLLVSKMQQSAQEHGIEVEVFASGVSNAEEKLANKEVDVLLLGPQVRFQKAEYEKKVEGRNIPVEVINMQDYGMVDGEKILQTALNLIHD